jgi:hypothetical protein|tara:strand:+ start:781 stop:978 length:198 start_codon:yes stop_codon:yes gene_type:complete
LPTRAGIYAAVLKQNIDISSGKDHRNPIYNRAITVAKTAKSHLLRVADEISTRKTWSKADECLKG